MVKGKEKSRKMSKGLILGALALYVVFGGIAIGVYFRDFNAQTSSPAAEAEAESGTLTQSPAPSEVYVRDDPVAERYDTDEGTAGAARDLDLE